MSEKICFLVDEAGTLEIADFNPPTCRAEYYDDISEDWSGSPQYLYDAMSQCQPLAWEVQSLYEDFRDELVYSLSQAEINPELNKARIAALKDRLRRLPEEPESGVSAWLLSMSESEFDDSICPTIERWFSSEPNWNNEGDYLPETSSAQGLALRYFRSLDSSIPDKIGVKIIEGDHPGSTYYAAELLISIEEGNERAKKMDLPIRFERNSS